MSKSKVVRAGLLGSAAALGLLGASPALAYETQYGDFQITFDTTVSAGASMRTAERETQFLPEANGGPIDPRANVLLGATGVGTIGTPVGFGGAPCAVYNAINAGVATCGGSNTYNNPYSNFDGTINADDARLNFDKGDLIGANVKANHDLIVKWHNYTLFARAVGFYDVVMNDKSVGERSLIDDRALGDVGRNYELLDLFLSADYTIADMPLNLRVGKQVINWGESTFILGGNNVFNPIDVGAFRRPGSEIKEALVPVNAVSASISLPFDVSLSGYYSLDWEPFELDPSGTPFSGSDLLTAGGGLGGNQMYSFVTASPFSGPRRNCTAAAGSGTDFVHRNGLLNDPTPGLLGIGVLGNSLLECSDNTYVNYQTAVPVGQTERIRLQNALVNLIGDGVSTNTSSLLGRGLDPQANDGGQFGLSARLYVESLGGTEFGAYYQNYHSRLPFAHVGVAPGAQAEFQFFINGDNTARNSTTSRLLNPAGCSLTNPALIGTINGVAGLTMAGTLGPFGPLGDPLTPGTAAYQMANTPVLDPGNVLATAAGNLAVLSGGLFTMNPTNGFRNQLAITQLNCALAYYQSGFVDPDGAGPGAITIQSFDGAEFALGAGGGELFFTYPEDIQVFGFSFNTTVGSWGLQGDFTYRPAAPFQVDGDSLTIAALVNGCVLTQLYGAAGGIVNALATQDGSGFQPRCGAARTLSDGVMYNEMFTGQIGTTATYTGSDWFVDALGADLAVVVSEVGMVYVPDVEDTWLDQYDPDGPFLPSGSTYRGPQYANTGCQGTDLPGAGILGLDIKSSKQCRPNDFSAGLVALVRMDYNNVLDSGFMLSPQLVYAYDFVGTTPAPYGNYMEDRQSVGVSLTGTLNNNFRVSGSYSSFFGGHINNKAKDTDFASVSASYSF